MSHWFNRALAATLPLVPKPIVARVSARYIAGETAAEALETVRALNRDGMIATLDVLGEFVPAEAAARRAGEEYQELLTRIHTEGLDGNVSLKLTQMGLKIDRELCYDITRSVLEKAERLGNFVRIDMEDATCTDDTLEIFRRLHEAFPGRVGCVIQAYLKRSLEDVRALVEMGANVRLCKGIYVESPDIAYKTFREINDNFVRLLDALLRGGCYVGIATHDDELVDAGLRQVEELGRDRGSFEFQMLLGVRPPLRRRILESGHRLRIYIPFGSHWYAYSLRRLKENPDIVGHIMGNFWNGGS